MKAYNLLSLSKINVIPMQEDDVRVSAIGVVILSLLLCAIPPAISEEVTAIMIQPTL